MRRQLVLAGLLLTTLGMVVAACGNGGKPNTSPKDNTTKDNYERPDPPAKYQDMDRPEFTDEMVKAGKEIFAMNCASCHGPEGLGNGPAGKTLNPAPQDLTNPDLQAAFDDHYIFWRITVGGAPRQSGMTAFEHILSEEERWQVIAYIRTLAK